MFKTIVKDNPKSRLRTGHMTNAIKSEYGSIDFQESDTSQTLTKIMFVGLAITSAVIFYLAISSLML